MLTEQALADSPQPAPDTLEPQGGPEDLEPKMTPEERLAFEAAQAWSAAITHEGQRYLNVTQLGKILDESFKQGNVSIYSKLRNYLDAGVAEALGGVKIPGNLGLRYPESSLPHFERMMQLDRSGEITAKVAAAQVKTWVTPDTETGTAPTAPLTPRAADMTTAAHALGGDLTEAAHILSGAPLLRVGSGELEEIFRPLLAALGGGRSPYPPVDPRAPILTTEEAATYLRCHPSSVSRFVRHMPGRRGRYLRVDCDRYIESMAASEPISGPPTLQTLQKV